MSNDNGGTTDNGGFVSPTAPDDDEIDLAAPVGTPEFDRAQEEVMIRGAADASSETEGPLEPGEGDGHEGDDADEAAAEDGAEG